MIKKGGQVIFLIGLMVLCLLLGSESKEENHGLDVKEPITVILWHYFNGVQDIELNELVTEFNNTVGVEKGIIVLPQSKGSIADLSEGIHNAAAQKVGAEELPNMFQCYLDAAVELDEYDLFVDLDTYVSAEERAEYVSAYIEEGRFGADDRWKLFPIIKSTETMALNKTEWDLFAKETGAKVEQLSTWEGLAQTAQDYAGWSGGESFFGRDAFANYMLIGSRQLGSEIFLTKGKEVTFQCDEAVLRKLWDNFYVPYIKGYYKQVGKYRTDDIKIGEIIALVGSTSGMAYFPSQVTRKDESPTPITHMILPVPNFAGEDKYSVLQGGGIGVVKATEAEEYACTLFLKWFTDTDRNISFAMQSGYLPVKKEANHKEAILNSMEKQGILLSKLQIDTMDTALSQMASGKLYAQKGFAGATQARAVLESSMRDRAMRDRKMILSAVKKGKSKAEAEAVYLNDDNFEDWCMQLKKDLEHTRK